MKTANAPLFKDPIHNGAADPVVIYNEETGTHYMLYTARRADVEEEGVMWVHGTDIIEYKGIILDNQSRNVKVDGKDIAITFKEFELLKYLLKNKGTVVPREVLLEKIWGYHFEGESRTLDVHIGSLRHKLGEKGKCIETIRNVGYKI